MKVTKSFLATSVLLLFPVFAGGLNSQEELTSQKQVSDTLHQMYEAEKRKDLHFVLSHLSDDFAEVAGDGNVYHRSDIEAGWSDVTLKNYKLSDCIFNSLAGDVAYLSCRMELDATYKGKPFPGRFRVTWVWTRQKGSWLIRFEQGTVITVLTFTRTCASLDFLPPYFRDRQDCSRRVHAQMGHLGLHLLCFDSSWPHCAGIRAPR